MIIIIISSQNASLPPRDDILVDAVLDAAVAGLLHLGRHFFNLLTLTSKGIFFQRGSLPLDFSQKAREALFFFLPSFLSSSLPFCGECHEKTAATAAASSARPKSLPPSATDRPACARIDRMSNRTDGRSERSHRSPRRCIVEQGPQPHTRG